MQRVILDVDTGIDDALAISYAVRSELDVIGITTCYGNVSVENATKNTFHVLEQLGVQIPVIKGASTPLFHHGLKKYSTHFHGENGLANTVIPTSNKPTLPIHATQFIINQIKKYPHEVTLICMGSLTNLALTIMQEPEVISLFKKVVIMGGAVTVPGNNQMHAEANIYADPEAAELVFQSGVSITLVGLDVTMKTSLTLDNVNDWRAKDTKLSHFLAEITEFYIGNYIKFYGDREFCALHDPLAVAVAIDPSLVDMQPMVLHVDLEGLYSYGRTIPDLRSRCSEKPNVDVCIDVDSKRFIEHFLHHVV